MTQTNKKQKKVPLVSSPGVRHQIIIKIIPFPHIPKRQQTFDQKQCQIDRCVFQYGLLISNNAECGLSISLFMEVIRLPAFPLVRDTQSVSTALLAGD